MLTNLKHQVAAVRRPPWLLGITVAAQRISSHIKRRKSVYGVAFVFSVTTIGMILTAQGWRSRMVAFDFITYIRGIHHFLATGTLPQHGDIGSYGSFKPAGTAWLMLPSTLLSSDPRLADYAGTTLLHLATLLGVFLLARKYF